MSPVQTEFPRLKSIRVVVEERKVAMEMSSDTWRTFEFTGIEAVPEKLRPAFAKTGMPQCELDLMELVRRSYRSGRVENRFEIPYRVSHEPKSPTVLRSVIVVCQYRREARAQARQPTSGCRSVAMPMACDGLWSEFELGNLEKALKHRYAALSSTVISAVVRLAKLDLRPSMGIARLRRHAEALIEARPISR